MPGMVISLTTSSNSLPARQSERLFSRARRGAVILAVEEIRQNRSYLWLVINNKNS